MWQWFSSLQVWAMPMTGLVRSTSSKPDALNQARRVRPQLRASTAPRVLRAKESLMEKSRQGNRAVIFHGYSRRHRQASAKCRGELLAGGPLDVGLLAS